MPFSSAWIVHGRQINKNKTASEMVFNFPNMGILYFG
ncbi:hypothetical protein X474_02175 [Dethiosulfatarculus sandiegensis]|uniref:Uncharacterized protein n=1 Tax=Dethiosulfatarculus sandiegensis TaxID=1429043 RepID=A0A0D2JJ23_9BACT|nr:hypothetical protein X474_02175 [Dethiosulfatarculus sandiegensis]